MHNTLGAALWQKGDLTAARVEFAEAARLNKLKADHQAALATNTGIQKLKEGALVAALERFEAALKLDPSYAPTHYQLGLVLQKLSKRGSAGGVCARAL